MYLLACFSFLIYNDILFVSSYSKLSMSPTITHNHATINVKLLKYVTSI